MNITKLKLPVIPNNIVSQIYDSITTGSNIAIITGKKINEKDQYAWITANTLVQEWCKENISPDIHWGIQVIRDDLPIHRDNVTKVKFNYIIEPGGNVITHFYDDDKQLIESIKCELNTWYILNVESYHSIKGIEAGQQRISITGRIIP